MTPTEVFADLHRAAEALGGARLFTVSVQDTAAGLARRAYTSDAAAYPLSVPKPIQQDDWSRRVLVEGQPFIANTTAEFAPYFFDHAQINALGCFSAANLPVIVAGEVLGSDDDAGGSNDGGSASSVIAIPKTKPKSAKPDAGLEPEPLA